MSQAFEYGGIDREPVQWLKERLDELKVPRAEHPENFASMDPMLGDLHLDIEHMLLTQ